MTSAAAGRIARRFAELASQRRTALVPFVTAGDPLPEAMVALMHALVDAGADLIELGVPFSDPMADGPVIQHASERAIARGVGLHHVLEWVREFRLRDAATPVVLMGYMNPVEVHGAGRFGRDAVAAGVDGVLLVDCPIEEWQAAAPLRAAGLDQVLLAAPTTHEPRLSAVCAATRGFLYYVSFAGITGADRLSLDDVRERVALLRERCAVPIAVGFGIRDAASATVIGEFADAVVIGSALVERLAGAATEGDLRARAHDFLAPIRAALDGAGSGA